MSGNSKNNTFSLVDEQTIKLGNTTITINNAIQENKAIYPYPPLNVLKTITVESKTKVYGTVTMDFDIYFHPQVRNGVKISTSKKVTKENSSGFIVCYQKNADIKVPRLRYTKKMKPVVMKKHKQLITEDFKYFAKDGRIVNKPVTLIKC